MFRIVLCLGLGAISTVVVAWSCALWAFVESPPASHLGAMWTLPAAPPPGSTDAERHWMARMGVGPIEYSDTPTPIYKIETRGLGVTCTGLNWSQSPSPGFAHRDRFVHYQGSVSRVRCGWPLRCFEGYQTGRASDQFIDPARTFRLALTSSVSGLSWMPADRVIPLGVLRGKLAANVLIHAACWWGVFWLIGTMVRGRRVLRGVCPKCRYDLRGNLAEGCSECGWRRDAPRTGKVVTEAPLS